MGVKTGPFIAKKRNTGWRKKKRLTHLHALFSRVAERNQHESMYVIAKHLQICVGIFA